MNWRVLGFVVSAGMLVGHRVWLSWRKRALEPTVLPQVSQEWNWRNFVLASFLTLFTELALIRWVGTEIRIFAYVKNLALLVCFLGFGLGCALARSPLRWRTSATALLGLVMVVRSPWHGEQVLEGLSQSLGGAQDIQIWATGTVRHWPSFIAAAAVVGLLLLLIACVFIPLGQTVSRQLELAARPLRGYSWNLAASIAGILVFFAASWLGTPPSVWLGVAILGLAMLQSERRERIWFASLVIPAVLLLHDVSTPLHFSFWTPYQQIEVDQQNFSSGEFARAMVRVNHTSYQTMVNLSPEFLARHPNLLKGPADENPYNLPFRFVSAQPRVLIVGSGAGNDVAAALRHQSQSVDAVEIDPAILALGKRHPEQPYSSPRVSVQVTDARAFMKRASARYDLVLFGLLDSHTQVSDHSNMRIDNFVYTEESFREARALLTPTGVLFVKFQVNHPWMGRRLEEMLTDVFGKKPLVFTAESLYTVGATCFAISPSGQVEERLTADPRLQEFVMANQPDFLGSPPVPVTTDDWPYLYQQGRWIPGIFLAVSGLVVLLGLGLYRQIPGARNQVPSLFFFGMGAGFLLLEAQVISRLALYFGTTWQVNGIVIGAILAALLVANTIVERRTKLRPRWWTVVGLLAGLGVAYLTPFSRIPGPAGLVGWVAAMIFAIPVFFAGLLFASEFRAAKSPSAALGANMLGAVVGGLLENLSLIIGLKALLLVAMGLYGVAACGLVTNRKAMVQRGG